MMDVWRANGKVMTKRGWEERDKGMRDKVASDTNLLSAQGSNRWMMIKNGD